MLYIVSKLFLHPIYPEGRSGDLSFCLLYISLNLFVQWATWDLSWMGLLDTFYLGGESVFQLMLTYDAIWQYSFC